MIVGKKDVDLYGAPTLHYVRPRPPRACLILLVFYGHLEHGVAPCGDIIFGILNFFETEKSGGKKMRDVPTALGVFSVQAIIFCYVVTTTHVINTRTTTPK